ncbi:electron transfer flavoprotein subunit beta [Modicisalibacter tunisiensis]|uniref:electron transfer flavoprotein subunit beta n=1 Tax=Modicisalibacter tunisiensis TaxID=390637 RepID=UPI001CCA7A38|nr:electron transfer flavoprotein subunit beta [Modicisalibacter tunisiensis]MBZ9540324.1 electron transfer flavoprotein subunit beta [Modicisalibacter tunisiensis]
MSHDRYPASTAGLEVAVLVSVGRHPLTGRARRADQDARAVELALELNAARVRLVHAGRDDSESEAALRGYLGMGFASLTRIDQPEGADALPALLESLREAAPQLLLTGSRAETGEGSGLLPYLLGEELGWPVVTGIAAVESVEGGTATLLQALPRGQRRRLRVRLPAVITVDEAAPTPRQSAFGPARRGTLADETRAVEADDALAAWTLAPARPRPKRLKIVKATSARERFKAAAAKAEGGGGQVLTDVTPEEGAEAIFNLLKEEGVLRR